ncbi:MAG TPA: methyl-accepting chemotaxis protein [Usitatibacter sp.]|nr:methyl-accepting chemotaxis protein [Usitatibacter sp.]
MKLRNFRIGTRLYFGFGSIVVIMLGALAVTSVLDDRSREGLAAALEGARAKESLAAEMRATSLAQAVAMRDIALQTEVKAIQEEEVKARRLIKAYDELVGKLTRYDLTPAERAIAEDLVQIDKAFDVPIKEALGLAQGMRGEEAAKVIMKDIDPLVQRSQAGLEKLIRLQDSANRRSIEAAAAEAANVRRAVFMLALTLSGIAILVAWFTTRSITGPLNESVALARRVAEGDLTGNIEVAGRDEAGQLQAALRDMNLRLDEMVQQIRTGSEAIAVGAGQVAAGNQQLSSRTEEHASSLEETASTLEEFTTNVRQNADHARRASELAGTASASAHKGGEAVANVVQTMQGVKASSTRVSEIVNVIDGIAFQTNILALNAAVEAARAGDQGRGFAVVASEVRSLAQRSAASAKEIRGLIEESVGRIEDGARQVEHAGKTMDEIMASVKSVAAIMGDIASASTEQSSGIDQINKAIAQMDHVVQMNASLVEEATAAAASMAIQAGDLARSVARFRVTGDEAGAREAPQPSVPTAAKPLPRKPRKELVPAAAATEEWREF